MTDLRELAERVEARPSLFMASMCALAVFFITGTALHFFNEWMGFAPWAQKSIQSLGVGAALMTWWQVRYEPVSKLTAALRAIASEQEKG